jgi:hypothetical protein
MLTAGRDSIRMYRLKNGQLRGTSVRLAPPDKRVRVALAGGGCLWRRGATNCSATCAATWARPMRRGLSEKVVVCGAKQATQVSSLHAQLQRFNACRSPALPAASRLH